MKIFIGIPIEDELKNEITHTINHYQQKKTYPYVRWVKPDNLHSTLFFIGETEESLIPLLKEKLNARLDAFKPIHTHCEKLITLPNEKHPRVLAYSLKPTEKLIKLAALVREALQSLEFQKPDYRFLPHITLARIRSPEKFKAIQHFPKPKSLLEVKKIIIYESLSTEHGVKYLPLEIFEI